MMEDAVLPIREFSRLTGISRETLRFYDNIGLLSPESRGKNSYRYYSARQLEFAFLISALRALGMGLKEIKQYADDRTPKGMLALLRAQNAHIEAEIQRLRSIQFVMGLRAEAAEDALQHVVGTVVLEARKREPIFLCPLPERRSTDTEAVLWAYHYAADHGISISNPSGLILSNQYLEISSHPVPAQFYFKVRKEYNAWKSSGTYAVYHYRPAGQPEAEPYLPLLSFLKEKGLRMVGDVYEEYPLDEFSTHRWEEYRARVEVRVVSDG